MSKENLQPQSGQQAEPSYRVSLLGGDGAFLVSADASEQEKKLKFQPAISLRREIVKTILDRQKGYLTAGPRDALIITQRNIADELGVHESAVSRAIKARRVGLWDGREVSLDSFFNQGIKLQYWIGVVLDNNRSLNDVEVQESLGDIGVNASRRIVTKYRAKMGVPVASMRKY